MSIEFNKDIGNLIKLKYGDSVELVDEGDGIKIRRWDIENEEAPRDLKKFFEENMHVLLDAKANEIREIRNKLLAATDYIVLPDYTIDEEDLLKVKTYRQALRDITKQEGFPENVRWPKLQS